MKKALQALNQIDQCNGPGSADEKIRLLQFNETDELRYLLEIAFSPLVTTNIKLIPLVHSHLKEDDCTFEKFKELMDMLGSRRGITKDVREVVGEFVYSKYWTDVERNLLIKIITQSLNIGVGAKTINKCFHNIPTPFLMKANPDSSIIQKWFAEGKKLFAEFKYDGVRLCAIMVNDEVASILTYDLTQLNLELVPNLVRRLNTISKGPEQHIIDFEITKKARTSISGDINKVIKGTAKPGIDDDWVANVFDIVDYSIINSGKGIMTQAQRRAILEGIFATHEVAENVILAKIFKVASYDELLDVFTNIIEEGYEGLVVKLATGVYESRRSKSWVKMKGINDCDLEITGWFSGKKGTKREHTIGGFICESSDRKLSVNVGSGLTDKFMNEIVTNTPDSYIGRIAKIRYNMVIANKVNDKKSLFLPRFVELRHQFDKDVADKLEDIKIG